MVRGRETISLKKVVGRGHFTGSGEEDNLRGQGSGEDTGKRQISLKKVAGRGAFYGVGRGIYTKNNRWRGVKTGPAREIWSISGVGDHFHVAAGLFYGVGEDFG